MDLQTLNTTILLFCSLFSHVFTVSVILSVVRERKVIRPIIRLKDILTPQPELSILRSSSFGNKTVVVTSQRAVPDLDLYPF